MPTTTWSSPSGSGSGSRTAPDLEIDIALGNIGLDHLGVARALYSTLGKGEGRTEDEYAMGRTDREFRNLLLVEQPNGDFAHTIVRQFFVDATSCSSGPTWPAPTTRCGGNRGQGAQGGRSTTTGSATAGCSHGR
jgi:hypothetical protein